MIKKNKLALIILIVRILIIIKLFIAITNKKYMIKKILIYI